MINLKNDDHMDKFGAGFTKEDIFQLCSNVLINSSIAIACGPFLDRDIMHSMDICISGKFFCAYFFLYLLFRHSLFRNKRFALNLMLVFYFVQLYIFT